MRLPSLSASVRISPSARGKSSVPLRRIDSIFEIRHQRGRDRHRLLASALGSVVVVRHPAILRAAGDNQRSTCDAARRIYLRSSSTPAQNGRPGHRLEGHFGIRGAGAARRRRGRSHPRGGASPSCAACRASAASSGIGFAHRSIAPGLAQKVDEVREAEQREALRLDALRGGAGRPPPRLLGLETVWGGGEEGDRTVFSPRSASRLPAPTHRRREGRRTGRQP